MVKKYAIAIGSLIILLIVTNFVLKGLAKAPVIGGIASKAHDLSGLE